MQLNGRVSLGSVESEKRNLTWRIVLKFGLVLILVGATGNVLCQNQDSDDAASSPKPDLRGKSIFEGKCATCHGLDGLGGEHAPDIVRRSEAKTLSDEQLVNLIHDGIPEEGMPGFPSMKPSIITANSRPGGPSSPSMPAAGLTRRSPSCGGAAAMT